MDQNYYPFTNAQYFKLLDAVKNHKKILFTGAPGSGKTFAMYRLVTFLKQDTAEEFSIFEMESEAPSHGLTSTILPQFGTSRLPGLLADSEGTTRVFETIRPMYAYAILALCKERNGLITSIPCRYPEFAKQTLQEKLGPKSVHMADNAFDLCVHISHTVETAAYGPVTKVISADILDYNQLC